MDEVSSLELRALLGKYEEMLRMRLHDEAHPGGDPRREMAALAARFPGALRELDEAPLEAIRGRIAELSRCLEAGEPPAPWMHATAQFHRLTRGALAAKRWLGARRSVDGDVAELFVAAMASSPLADEAREWAADLARVAAPPRGRLIELVLERIAAKMGVSKEEARRLTVGASRAERRARR
jgi:hypothetical protein